MKTAAYIFVALLVAFGIYWFFFRKPKTDTDNTTSANNKAEADATTQAAAFATANLLTGAGIAANYTAPATTPASLGLVNLNSNVSVQQVSSNLSNLFTQP
jgi:hypothetical protein